MRQTIVFFDIDGVIFDAQKFFAGFCDKFVQTNNLDKKEREKLKNLYEEVKEEKGFFDPEAFLAKISSQYSITKEGLERLWWDEDSFGECLLIDENFLKQIQEKAVVGIFSKGEINFQKKKIEKFDNLINPEDIYIFEDKTVRISKVLARYRDYKIYVVDDNQKVLESFKQIDKFVYTILIKRGRAGIVINDINVVIESVLQLVPLLTQ
jgi:phosphoglycolate phosphatase-like HAD superfamily hydrolase